MSTKDKQDAEKAKAAKAMENNFTRVLVLVNENSPVFPALLFLKKHGYKIKVVHRVTDAVRELAETHPDILMLSWNLRKVDIRKAYKLFSMKFDSICVVFGEDNTNKTSTNMMASGIANTLLPPVSGPGIHMRIQALLKKRKMQINQTRELNTIEELTPLTVVKTKDIPADTKWEKMEGEERWQGVHEQNGKKSLFFFDGPDAPVLNPHKKEWEGFGKVEVRMSSVATPKQMKIQFNAKSNLPPEASENTFDDSLVETPLAIPKKDKNKKEDAKEDIDNVFEAVTILKPKGEKTSLARGMKKAVSNSIVTGNKNDPNLIQIQTKITVTTLKTSRFQGYIVGAHASDIPDSTLMEEVLKNLGTTMQDLGEPLSYKTRVLELEVDPIPFMMWVDSKAEFFVKSRHRDNEVAYAYLPFMNMPDVIPAEDNNDLIGIKLSSINPGKSVPFEIYIYMPKNNKYLLYAKAKAVVTAKIISKLIRFGIKHVYILKADEEKYQTYCAKYKIAEAYEDFKKVS